MPYGLYLSAEGAEAQSTRLDVIANNLANVDTVGFKRELAVLRARYAEAIEEGETPPDTGGIDDVGGGIEVLETRTDFTPGKIKPTGAPTDVAIRGDGFFQVRKGDETYLTRAGNFAIASDGRLTTQQGFSVLDESGSEIYIRDPSWYMTNSGAVRQAGALQNLALVMPESLGDLVKVGQNLFRSLSEPENLPADERLLTPRHLEQSTVRPTTAMIDMIEASRAMEANINMMKAQDEMLSGLVNRVMRV